MRYFCMIAWVGRLRQREAVTDREWNPGAVRYEDEKTVDTILAMMPTDRKVKSLADIDEAVRVSSEDAISRVLWVPEELLEEVTIRATQPRS